MRKLPPLNAIRAFEAAARNRSFTAAASELCVTVTAVSHQIRHLEDQIGQKLFERTPRAVTLTLLGEKLFPALREGFDRFAEAFEELDENSSGDTLTVTTTRAFAERWLMPRLSRFTRAYPELGVNVEGADALVDLRTANADVAIRYGMPAGDELYSLPLLDDVYHPTVATGPGSIASSRIEDYRPGPLLTYKWHNRSIDCPTWAKWLRAAGKPDEDYRLSWINEESLALHALERGFGPLLCSSVMVSEGIKDGRLMRLDGPDLKGFSYRIAYVPTRKTKRAIGKFTDWLRSEASEFGSTYSGLAA
jgi:LysR family glycine cleavage system transcriptional activator